MVFVCFLVIFITIIITETIIFIIKINLNLILYAKMSFWAAKKKDHLARLGEGGV